jgi:YcxB-like protein
MSVTIEYEFDSADHYVALGQVTKRTSARWLIWVSAAVFCAVALWVFWSGARTRNLAAALISALPWVFIGAFWVAMMPSTQKNVARAILWACAAVVVAIAVWAFSSSARTHDLATVLISVLPWALIVGFWAVMLRWMPRITARTAAQRDPMAVGQQRRTVDDEGIHLEGNGVRLDVQWRAVVKAVETAEMFLFFYNKNCAYYIPKRVATPEESDAIRARMKSALGDRALVE